MKPQVELTTDIYICPIINVQKEVNAWIIGDFQEQHLTELLFLKRFRQNQNENTSKKLIFDLIFDPLTDSTR